MAVERLRAEKEPSHRNTQIVRKIVRDVMRKPEPGPEIFPEWEVLYMSGRAKMKGIEFSKCSNESTPAAMLVTNSFNEDHIEFSLPSDYTGRLNRNPDTIVAVANLLGCVALEYVQKDQEIYLGKDKKPYFEDEITVNEALHPKGTIYRWVEGKPELMDEGIQMREEVKEWVADLLVDKETWKYQYEYVADAYNSDNYENPQAYEEALETETIRVVAQGLYVPEYIVRNWRIIKPSSYYGKSNADTWLCSNKGWDQK